MATTQAHAATPAASITNPRIRHARPGPVTTMDILVQKLAVIQATYLPELRAAREKAKQRFLH